MEEEKPPIKEIIAKKDSNEWKMDTKGYFIIDPQPEQGKIYAHFYKKDGSYEVTIVGKNAEEIYYTILRENLISTLMHAAYLGNELQKAEIHVRHHVGTYTQDEPLFINARKNEEE